MKITRDQKKSETSYRDKIDDLEPPENQSTQLKGGYQTGGSGHSTTACADGKH